jgi:hypothetical protein
MKSWQLLDVLREYIGDTEILDALLLTLSNDEATALIESIAENKGIDLAPELEDHEDDY